MFWFGPPRAGDWVVARRSYSSGVVDVVAGIDTIRARDRGVVLSDTTGFLDPHVTVCFSTGCRDRVVSIPVRHLRVVSRGRGEESFAKLASTLRWIQLGAVLVMVAAMAWFFVLYRRQTGSFDGIVSELAIGSVYSVLDLVEYLLTDPVRAMLFLVVSVIVGAVAFGRLR